MYYDPSGHNESGVCTPPDQAEPDTQRVAEIEDGSNTATIIDYSYKFDRELANFNDGYERRTTVDKRQELLKKMHLLVQEIDKDKEMVDDEKNNT